MIQDDQPSGDCVTCRRRDAREGYVCGPCRSRLRSWLGEIPDLYAEALERVTDVDAKVAFALGSPGKAGPVSGTPERRLPLHEDLFDLTHAGALRLPMGEDQVGHLSVLVVLRSWAGWWAGMRAMGELGGRRQGIANLCWWMRERVDDVCDADDQVNLAYDAIGQLRGALRALLGETDQKPRQLHGVKCRQCGQAALWQHAESDYAAECAIPTCRAVLKPDEYDEWLRESAVNVRRILRSARPAA